MKISPPAQDTDKQFNALNDKLDWVTVEHEMPFC